MARFVEDLNLILPIICGPDWQDPAIVPVPLGDPAAVEITRLRAAVHTDNGIVTPTAAIQNVVRRAAQALIDWTLAKIAPRHSLHHRCIGAKSPWVPERRFSTLVRRPEGEAWTG